MANKQESEEEKVKRWGEEWNKAQRKKNKRYIPFAEKLVNDILKEGDR